MPSLSSSPFFGAHQHAAALELHLAARRLKEPQKSPTHDPSSPKQPADPTPIAILFQSKFAMRCIFGISHYRPPPILSSLFPSVRVVIKAVGTVFSVTFCVTRNRTVKKSVNNAPNYAKNGLKSVVLK